MKLDFLVAGFSKCGTTSLCALLDAHPQVFIPPMKETNFFIEEDYLQRLDWYAGLFAAASSGARLGEGCQFYSSTRYERAARDRILLHSPHVRLIFIARDPIDRIESSYREFHHSGPRFGLDAPFGIGKALCELPDLVDDTRYWSRLANYRERVPDERILLLFNEDLLADSAGVMARCWDFLGVARRDDIARSLVRLNEGGTKLHDTRVLRCMRRSPLVGPWLSRRFDIDTQDRLGQLLGLRRAFRRPIAWDDEARRFVVNELAAEAAKLLAFAGKPFGFWPRLAAWVAEFGIEPDPP